jgi:ABC-type multidrug transport system ATPase subunit
VSADGAAVHARGLRKAYGGIVAVDGVDRDVARGECFGFLGPNGAGKTTTMKVTYGLAPWLLAVTVVLFLAVPARAMRRRLVA